MVAEDGLKAQKLLAQGSALGFLIDTTKSPCKGKSLQFQSFCPYRATCLRPYLPRVLPWARSFCPFRARGVQPVIKGHYHFQTPKRIRSWKFCSLLVVVNWGLIFHNQVYDICNSCEFRKFDAYADEIFFEGRLNPRYFFFTVLKSIHGKLCFI